MTLSTHVLDTARGLPAQGIAVTLVHLVGDARIDVASGLTDADGRIASPFGGELDSGSYELSFAAGFYFAKMGTPSFYDEIPIRFHIDAGIKHYHVPLLLAPWAYSTYRGS
ncbi:MAG TPA: hydroxyisourate hydrolase [Verrucomicrobiae bacterium]|jgi:5-hydroxyisourate hydrolase|nr:hydroxyisourate hydrolase [Verrucomicrobiae bacterium]